VIAICYPHSVGGCGSSGVPVMQPSTTTVFTFASCSSLEKSRTNSMRACYEGLFLRGIVAAGGAAKTCTTALRMFLRFLIANGYCTVALEAAIPTLAHWRLATLPRSSNPKRWNVSSHRTMDRHPLVAGIGRFCSYCPDWVFGPATSRICA
jgi:hypothetical protein